MTDTIEPLRTNNKNNSSPKPYLYSIECEQSKETIPRAIHNPKGNKEPSISSCPGRSVCISHSRR